MNAVKVKICGIQSYEEAKFCIIVGANFLGFNFVPTSKRFIKHVKAKKIIENLKFYSSALNNIRKVGVFQNEILNIVEKIISYLNLDFVQLHGSESPKYASLIKNAGIIKTIPLEADFDVRGSIREMKKYSVSYFLFDRKVQGKGKLLNMHKIGLLSSAFPIILAGGLNSRNILEAIKLAHPQIVDVAGGVETDGVKDKNKIAKFIQILNKYH